MRTANLPIEDFMGWNDRIDDSDSELREFLKERISDGRLQDAALGIAKQVLDRGIDQLSEKQKFVFVFS